MITRFSCKIVVFIALASLGCASYTEETQPMRNLFMAKDFKDALANLEKSGMKSEGKNRLLYHLEMARIFDRLHDLKEARNHLKEADKIADELFTVSITRTAASYVVNESSTDYAGEDYEKVAIHTMLALSYIEGQELSAALVEARKINSKLYEINQAYGDNGNKYGEDAFARFLSAVIYEAEDKDDDAIIDYKKALELYSGSYAKFYSGSVPESVVKALYRLSHQRGRDSLSAELTKAYPSLVAEAKKDFSNDGGELVVIHEIGNIAIKQNEEFALPIGRQIVRFSFPVIRKDPYRRAYGNTGIRVEGVGQFSSENMQDMDAIASQTLSDRKSRLILKGGARLLAKGQLTEYAYDHFGPIAGLAANFYSAATETGDTRSWTLLPERFNVTRAFLPPGKQEVRIESAGRVADIRTVEIKKGKILIIRD